MESDGIARVYGMSNVQAEELVEYVEPKTWQNMMLGFGTNIHSGSPLVSRACA